MVKRNSMTALQAGIDQWQYTWGSPIGFFVVDRKKLEVALLMALFLHSIPMVYIWQKQKTKKVTDSVYLDSVELIEPEVLAPLAPPPQVQKPKSAFDFLKMALPIFRKPKPVPSIREIQPIRKIEKARLAEPEKLIDKQLKVVPLAPAIKLDPMKRKAPKIAEIAKIPSSMRPDTNMTREPALKLEEVGRRAVAPPPLTAPAIDLGTRKDAKIADIASIPKSRIAPRSARPAEKLLNRKAPVSYKPPPAPKGRIPLGYQRRGGGNRQAVQPREVPRIQTTPAVKAVLPKTRPTAGSELNISKKRVKITGPLSARKVLKSSVPDYPAWARARGIEAAVDIRFTVSHDGRVLDNAVVQRTSGHTELDKLAMTALMKWRFSPLKGSKDNQWGVITFRFLLD